jgi:tripeptide aminopeptidase
MANPTKTTRQKPAATPRKKARPARSVSTTPEFDSSQAIAMVMELMAIPGKSGQEAAVAETITKKLLAAGAPADAIRHDNANTKTSLDGQVGNLIFQMPGTVRAPRRLLMAHMDTVPICVGCQPVRRGDTIRSANPQTGLGGDDRAGVAVVLHTALTILRRKLPHPPLTFFWPIQEEVGLHGARYVQQSRLGKPRMAFNWDGGAADKLTIGATGGYRMVIEITGLAAHAGAAPERGVSAIAIAALAIAKLVQDGWHGLIAKDGQTGTSNVGYIHGGEATNVVTDRVVLKAEARSHNKAFRSRIVKAIAQAFDEAVAQVESSNGKRGKVRIDGRVDYEAFRLSPKDPSVATAARALRTLGLEPNLAISNGGLDANWMSAHGIPTVTLGCGQSNIHTIGETLDVREFEKACRLALLIATEIDNAP